MYNIAICDDDKTTQKKIAALVKSCAQKIKADINISYFISGEELLFKLCENPDSEDIIFLDIMMGGISGIDAAIELRGYGCPAQIIFLTDSPDFVFEAFDVQAANYILKSRLKSEKFEAVFKKTIQQASTTHNDSFVCEFKGRRSVLSFKNIVYFEIWNRVVTAHCKNGESAKFYSRMDRLEKMLENKSFARIHRSYIVNMAYITALSSNNAEIVGGFNLPVGSTYCDAFKKLFSDYVSGKGIIYGKGLDK